MNTSAVISVIAVGVVALAGSDVFKAELLTGFDASPDRALPGQQTIISMRNTGLLQADNVVVLIESNNTITDFTNICAEGQISKLDDMTLVVKFLRMSPDIRCELGIEVQEPVSLNFVKRSDGSLPPWVSPPLLLLLTFMVIGILVTILHLIFLFRVVERTLHHINLWLHRKQFKSSPHSTCMIDHVSKEYGIKINAAEATILEWIHSGKKTPNQLIQKSKLPRWQIVYRIKRLRICELLLSEKMEINEDLSEYLKTHDCHVPEHPASL